MITEEEIIKGQINIQTICRLEKTLGQQKISLQRKKWRFQE